MQVLFLLSIFLSLFFANAYAIDRHIHAEHVLLINGESGKVLWEKNADTPCYPASTTKIASTFFAIMQKPNSLKEKVMVPKEALIMVKPSEKCQANYSKCPSFWLESDGTSAGIKPGQILSFEELLYGAMLVSGNDASNTIAHYVSDSIESFVNDLNRFVQKLGCTNTRFRNPHGLHHPEHITTARDMAKIAKCAMYHPFFRKIVSLKRYERPVSTTESRLVFVNTNKMLHQGPHYYPYAIGIKSGYTSKASSNLVAAAKKNDRMLIAAIFKAKGKDACRSDARALFDFFFQEQKVQKMLLQQGEQEYSKLYDEAECAIKTYTKEPICISYYPSEEPEIRSLLVWDVVPLPILQGAKVGEIRILADGKEALSVPLFAQSDVLKTTSAKMSGYLKDFVNILMQYWLIILVAIILIAIATTVLRRR